MMEQEPKINIQELPEFIRPYFEAKEKGTLKEYYRGKFLHFKNDYLDDLPEVDVRNLATLDEKGNFAGDNYKCRGNYIFGLAVTLDTAMEDGTINEPELIKKIEDFRHHDFKHNHQEFTTKEEIDMINQILSVVIEYLEK